MATKLENGRLVPTSAADDAALATWAAQEVAEMRRQRIAALRQEAADLIDAAAGIDLEMPMEHRGRELAMLQATFSSLLDLARSRALTTGVGSEQAQLDALRSVFGYAGQVRAAEAAARAEVGAAVDISAIDAVASVASRLP